MHIEYQKIGQGTPLIILHGLFGTSDNLKPIAKALSDQYCVYLLDAPAHGNSDSLSKLSLANMAKAIETFCLEHNLSSISILGHSMGGKIAMELALSNPELVSKLIVADISPVQYERRHDTIINALREINLTSITSRQEADKQLSNSILEVGVRAFLLKSLKKNTEGQWQWAFDVNSIARDYDELIKGNRDDTFSKPTLFIIGGNSNYVTEQHREAIINRFPNVSTKLIQNAGHWLHAEKPVAFVKICRDFLSE
jgi:esterase